MAEGKDGAQYGILEPKQLLWKLIIGDVLARPGEKGPLARPTYSNVLTGFVRPDVRKDKRGK